ncbi:hypothetical protein DFQ27_003031 [Actinomortierella ambigua]|uniref:Uncharacterized protein n=1 Tax=Actinomortierella ambigua TaxID=1343610 RepID=A0A9P6UCN9_9FUNG|nr:hypothetical protein DFQ27_003031 [Actinomortierella ambigua]
MKVLSSLAVLAAVAVIAAQAEPGPPKKPGKKPWPIWGEIEYCGHDNEHKFRVMPGECKSLTWSGKVCDIDVPDGAWCQAYTDKNCKTPSGGNWHSQKEVKSIKCSWRPGGGGHHGPHDD